MRLSLRFVAGALALAILPGLCKAQSAPSRSRITVSHLKPDMVNEWVDLQKNEVVPALKKGGVKTRTVYATAIFGNAYEYVSIAPYQTTAQFDGPSPLVKALDVPGAARLDAKLRRCIVSQNSYMSTRIEEASNVLSTPPDVIVVSHYRIASGKMQEYLDLVKSDFLPVFKKAKVYFTVNQRGLGANGNDVTVVTGYAKFADVDNGRPLVQQLGAAEAAKINAKLLGIRTIVEVVTRRRVPDLCF
jgi:hypothetical protein